MDQWHYARSGQQFGPVSINDLQQLLARGEITGADFVWKGGMPQWMPAAQVPELLPAAAPGGAQPPPIPMPPMASYAPPVPGVAAVAHDPGMRWLIPVGRSGWAIAAGYLGLFSLVGCFAPISIIVSIIAIKDLKKHPELSGMGRAVTGLVLGILGCGILVIEIIGIASSRHW